MKHEEFPINVLLADDDLDDRGFFTMALAQLPIKTNLTIVCDGVELLNHLYDNPGNLPDIIFLDLTMPRKTGFECLLEIKEQDGMKDIPIILFSILTQGAVLREEGSTTTFSLLKAYPSIRKTPDFDNFKKNIYNAINMLVKQKKSGNEEGQEQSYKKTAKR
jgi:CheY-like chemotaxis protein